MLFQSKENWKKKQSLFWRFYASVLRISQNKRLILKKVDRKGYAAFDQKV